MKMKHEDFLFNFKVIQVSSNLNNGEVYKENKIEYTFLLCSRSKSLKITCSNRLAHMLPVFFPMLLVTQMPFSIF